MQVLQHLFYSDSMFMQLASQSRTLWGEMHVRAPGIAVSNKYLFSFWCQN